MRGTTRAPTHRAGGGLPREAGPDVGQGCCSTDPGSQSGPPADRPLGRRSLLAAAAAASASSAVLGPGAPAARASTPTAAGLRRGMEVVLLGTFAGPPPVPTRYGTSTAVVVDGAVYLVDCGRGSVSQYQRAGLAYADLAGVFITHLHADHIAEYYDLFLLGGTPLTGDQVPTGTPAYGPGPAGALPPAAGGAAVSTVNPADPTPGLAALTAYSHAAFAYSSNTFQRALPGVVRDPTTLMDPREIVVPDVGASALGDVAPAMAPFVVHEDDRVRVSAVLVPHGTVFPSFAFRFDSDHGSAVLSGDTRYSDNVVGLARSADLLVHEAIGLLGSPLPPPVADYQRTIHIEVDDVGVVAERAGAAHLALSHIIDFAAPVAPIDVRGWRRRAQRGYSGRVTVGEDLMRLPVGRRG